MSPICNDCRDLFVNQLEKIISNNPQDEHDPWRWDEEQHCQEEGREQILADVRALIKKLSKKDFRKCR